MEERRRKRKEDRGGGVQYWLRPSLVEVNLISRKGKERRGEGMSLDETDLIRGRRRV